MANYKNIVPFFYKWEGGKSSDLNDSASSYNCGVDGIHTNKGVTYAAWVQVFGKDNVKRFLEMNNDDWGVIFKRGYWDACKCDAILHQSIAECLVSWAWGSGANTAVRQMQRVLDVTVDGQIGNQTIGAINRSNEAELFEKCVLARKSFFEYIAKRNPKNLKFLKGWLNRLNDFKKTFHP